MFYFEKINNKKILKSDFLNNLQHCFTTRESVIKSNEQGLSAILSENKTVICNYFGVDKENLISPTQTHSSNVGIVKSNQKEYPNTDAIILTNKEQAVFLNFADCTPIILHDTEENICAVIHAGWRGTAEQISKKTVHKMIKEFNSTPKNIVAAIGPTIDRCCFCIGEEVYDKLKSSINGNNIPFTKDNNKVFADLKKINYLQLLDTGVEKIDLCNYCTSCSNELFFSYRRENGTTSRHSAIVKLV